MLKNNQVDIITNVVDFPSRLVLNAVRGLDVRFLGFGPALVEKVNARLGTTPITIPANAYPFQPEPVHTFRAHVVLLTSAAVPAATVEAVVNAIIAHFDTIKRAHATMARLEVRALPDTGGVALHEGAQRAYRAAGLMS
jgi:TRAP transporter TAXI family solute receptor